MRLKYNSPIILSFALISTIVLLVSKYLMPDLTSSWFTAPAQFSFNNFMDYPRMFSHVIGHADVNHLLGNFTFILLLGPIIEEKYGSGRLLAMILLTALVTGLGNAFLFKTGLLGASGIVFMLIIISSFTNIKDKEIPITFLLIVGIFLSKEVVHAFQENNISEFAHIIGGLCGGLYGVALAKGGEE
jgi:rhomboid protease GluP